MTNFDLNRRGFLKVSRAVAAGGVAYGLAGPATVRAQVKASVARLPLTIVNTGGPIALCFEEIIARNGYFEELGLDAKTVNVSDTVKIIGSLVGGDTDVCMLAGMASIFQAAEKGAKLKVLAEASALAPISLFSSKPEIKTLKDIEGRIVGTGAIGAALHQITIALLQKRGIDVSKVTFVNIGSTSDILRAIVAGTVEVGTVNVDAYDSAEANKIHPVADFFTELAEYPYQGSFTTEAAIKNKREQIVRALAAYSKLYRFIQSPNSKDQYVDAYVKATGGKPGAGVSQWNFIQKYKPYASDLVIPDASVQYLQQINIQTGVQKAVIPTKDVADMSLALEAVKRIS